MTDVADVPDEGWRDDAKAAAVAAGRYVGFFALVIVLGLLLTVVLGLVGAFGLDWPDESGTAPVHGAAAGVLVVVILYGAQVLGLVVLFLLFPVAYVAVGKQQATLRAMHSLFMARGHRLVRWGVARVIEATEAQVPNLWSGTVSLDHQLVRRAYDVVERAENVPRLGRALLARVLRKADIPAMLGMEIKRVDESYGRAEVIHAVQERTVLVAEEYLAPSWVPFMIVAALHVVVSVVIVAW